SLPALFAKIRLRINIAQERMTDSANGGGGKWSRARDHLANERTYLAWLRTAVNVMVLGLAIAGFAKKATLFSVTAGGVLIAVGAVGLIYGTSRYRRVNREIEAGRYVTGTQGRGPALASLILIIAVLVALALLLIPDFLAQGADAAVHTVSARAVRGSP
ncbi:MAG TPA: DUF202 domain-containing protein, partial [Nitrococcus sp.]|nr:DUF202 domain-containing protein [Nitrococcus sp.]